MSTQAPQKATTHFPPAYPTLTRPSLILFGTIEPSPTRNWTTSLGAALSDLPIQILNPRRDDWDATWVEDPSFAPFRETVEWEMSHPSQVGLVVICFKARSQCPVTLLELGMYAALFAEKTVVCCEEGFWKRGNVEMVCGKFGVRCVRTTGELEGVVRERMEGLVAAQEGKEGGSG